MTPAGWTVIENFIAVALVAIVLAVAANAIIQHRRGGCAEYADTGAIRCVYTGGNYRRCEPEKSLFVVKRAVRKMTTASHLLSEAAQAGKVLTAEVMAQTGMLSAVAMLDARLSELRAIVHGTWFPKPEEKPDGQS